MKQDLTELVFILDKSGSMMGLESDTIGGFNAMLQKQKAVDGDCRITTVLFDHNYQLLHDRIDIRAVDPMTDQEYCVGGSTALLDAIGETIHKIKSVQAHTASGFRADKVLFVIITDGQENASRKYALDEIKAMIACQKQECSWEFVFLGANIDAVETAERFGISANRAQNYHADAEGVELNFRVMSDAVTSFRACAAMPPKWNAEIEKDFHKRAPKR